MPVEILVPRLGWTMEEGVFEGWLKKDGEFVQAGAPLFALEGEKATQDVEAVESGVLRIPPDAPKPGDVVAIGAVLGYLLARGEAPDTDLRIVGPRVTAQGASRPALPPATPRDSRREGTKPTISPRARRVARELGVDWTELRGTGRTGRIRECDVQAAFKRHQVTAPALAAQPTGRHIPLSSIRKTIAHRTRASRQTTAAVTLTTEADATNLVNLRGQFQSAAATKPGAGAKPLVPTYTDLIVKLTAAALQQHPMLMAQWTDEGLFLPDGIHIGIAVDTEAGLVAPVVREVPALTLRQLAAESRTLIELAHTRRLPADKLSGGTFTVTNLGMYGIDAFTPIIDPPQSSILGIGRIRREPAVVDDRIVPRERMTLSLTFDHRTIDGAPAARFLNTVRLYVENPGPRLMA